MNLVYPIAKVVFIFLALSYGYSTIVQGISEKFQNNSGDDTKLIANQLLFRNESTNIYYQIFIPEGEEPPLMMMSVMLVKTLDRDIEPSIAHIFRSFFEKKPVLDLSAVNRSQDVILTPSTSAFTIDIATKTLTAVPSPFMVRLHPYNESGIAVGDSETEPTITIKTANASGTTEYYVDFVLSVNSTDMEGLYKFYLHTSESVRTKFYTLPSKENISEKIHFIHAVFYMIIGIAIILHFSNNSLRPCLYHYCGKDDKHQLLTFAVWTVLTVTIYFLIWNANSHRCAYTGHVYLISFGVLAVYSFSCSTWWYVNRSWKNMTHPLHWILKDILHYVIISSIMAFVIFQSVVEANNYVQMKAMIFFYLLFDSWQRLREIQVQKTRLDNLRKEANPTKEIQKKIERIQEDGKELFKLHSQFLWFYILYAFAIPFNLTLATMTWLRVPYHLFWLPVTIEDVLQLCLLLLLQKMITAWNGFSVKHRSPAPKSINYSKEDIVSFVLFSKCFGSSERSDNQDDITNVSRRSVRDRIELTLWLVFKTETLQFLIVADMWCAFGCGLIVATCNQYLYN